MNLDCLPVSTESVLDCLSSVDVWTVAQGLENIADVISGSHAYRVVKDGEEIGAYCLRGQTLPHGVVAWLVAGQGRAPGIDLTRDLLPEIERQAQDADFLAIQTTRPGLVKKLAAQGYAVGGIIMVKKTK